MKTALFALIALGVVSGAAMPTNGLSEKKKNDGQETHGRIDWNKGSLFATGLGAISRSEKDDAKAYLRARSFARMDARRNLLAVIDSVKIDSQTTGQDYEATSEVIREQISGLLKGTEIISERVITIGNGKMLEVTMTMPLYGENGLANTFVPEMVERTRKVLPEPEVLPEGQEEEPAPVPVVPPVILQQRPVKEPAREANPGEPVTSVIIDLRGLNVERSMSPKIKLVDGTQVWGTLRVSPEFVIDQGIVAYATNMSDAKRNRRAGDNPLIIRASGRSGGRFATDAVLTDQDAATLIAANKRANFLRDFHVIFLLDPGK